MRRNLITGAASGAFVILALLIAGGEMFDDIGNGGGPYASMLPNLPSALQPDRSLRGREVMNADWNRKAEVVRFAVVLPLLALGGAIGAGAALPIGYGVRKWSERRAASAPERAAREAEIDAAKEEYLANDRRQNGE